MELTKYQQAVVDCPDRTILVDSVAGSGKTTTVRAYFENYLSKNPNAKILYLVYNKSMSEEAKKDIKLKNVDISTFHALAYRKVGVHKNYKHKLSLSYTAIDVANDLELSKNQYGYAYFLRNLWTEFIKSGQKKIDQFLFSIDFKSDKYGAAQVKDDLTKIFKLKQNPNNDVKIEHDFYAFLYFLCEDTLDEYDVLALDECQDSSAIVLDLFNRFKGKRIAVGDNKQNIYAFNNTVNLFDKVKDGTVLTLPESHRVSSEIGYICSMLYKKYLGDNTEVIGLNPDNKIVKAVNIHDRHVILARNNSTLFNKAIVYSEFNDCPLYFEGGIEGCKFENYLDFFYFKCGVKKRFNIPLLNQLEDWEDFKDYINETQDEELQGIMTIVNTYGDKIPTIIQTLKNKSVKKREQAQVVFSTIHKSKGLTFDLPLIICDDISDIADKYRIATMCTNTSSKVMANAVEKLKTELKDEINVIYVGITRGKNLIELPPRLIKAIQMGGY